MNLHCLQIYDTETFEVTCCTFNNLAQVTATRLHGDDISLSRARTQTVAAHIFTHTTACKVNQGYIFIDSFSCHEARDFVPKTNFNHLNHLVSCTMLQFFSNRTWFNVARKYFLENCASVTII